VDDGEVHLDAVQRRARSFKAQQPLLDPGMEVEADALHVAHQLRRRLLECEIETSLAACAGCVGEMRREAGLAGAGGAGNQHRTAAVIALAAQHVVQPRYAARDSLGARRVVELQRGERQDVNAVLVDEERVLVGAVGAAAILDDAQAPGGHLLGHTVVEQDHAVGDVLLQPLAREASFAALAGDDRGDALVLQPAEEAPQLRAQQRLVGEAAEEGLERVEHHALGAHRVDRHPQPQEQAFEVVFAGLVDLRRLDVNVVDRDFVVGDQLVEVEAERAHVLREILLGFLERHEDAGFAELLGAAQQEFHGEQRFAATGRAADERRPPAWQPAKRNLVESRDPGRCFWQRAALRLAPLRFCPGWQCFRLAHCSRDLVVVVFRTDSRRPDSRAVAPRALSSRCALHPRCRVEAFPVLAR
jgi:hypothetical protein